MRLTLPGYAVGDVLQQAPYLVVGEDPGFERFQFPSVYHDLAPFPMLCSIMTACVARRRARLKFAPGLFQVAMTEQAQGDALDVANQLVEAGLATFAEPVLREAIGPRSP